ncbi:MAG: flagellar filament capping protein FliD [Novosphingobium sp.]|nr:flagellar filament capping protein FliD [Novosphingobium sp.]MCP5401091.1 flagellar filament capping protein FliD [Novosphingobium sp.]
METTSTSSATRSLITALGAGSGVDMGALAENLAAAQYAGRLDRLALKSETLDRQISAASDLKSMMLSLAGSLGDRVRLGDLSPQPQVANGAVAGAAYSGVGQPTGSYSLEVTQLATSQTLSSPAYTASSDPVGAGTLTLRFGTISGTSFTEDTGHAAVNIEIASGSTLADVALAINASNSGVSAYVANTTEGAKLVLKGEEGAANGFILEAAETVGEEGLANLAWTPAGDASRRLTASGDAAFKIDGLPMTSSSNTVADPIPGVTLTLKGTNTGTPTTLSFADNSSTIVEAMQDLTAALNEIATQIRTVTDPQTGELARDSGARALRSTFSALAGTVIMPNAPEGTPRTLSDLGLTTQRDGSFTLDGARLSESLKSDPQAVAAMFTNGLYGVYSTIDSIARRSNLSTDPGTLAGSIKRYTTQLEDISEDQAKLIERQETLRTQLISRFAVVDNKVGASKSTLTFLQNQIDAWNAQRS